MISLKNTLKIFVTLLLLMVSASQAGTSMTYIHTDHLGSPIAATDEAGQVKWTEEYQPFGVQRTNQDSDNSTGFTGHQYDDELELTYMQARWYHPEVGRFMSLDPVDTLGHIQRGNPVQGFNRYAYANNNPYKYVDPDGEFIFTAIALAAVAYAAYEGYQEGGTEGAIAEASGYNDAVDSLDALGRGDYSGAAMSALGIVCKVCRAGKQAGNALDTVADNSKQALRNAKRTNNIPNSAQPDRTIKPNTPEGDLMGLDERNIKLYEYTNSNGGKIHIRQDKATSYDSGGKGDQGPHFNSGNAGSKLKQHHYYKEK